MLPSSFFYDSETRSCCERMLSRKGGRHGSDGAYPSHQQTHSLPLSHQNQLLWLPSHISELSLRCSQTMSMRHSWADWEQSPYAIGNFRPIVTKDTSWSENWGWFTSAETSVLTSQILQTGNITGGDQKCAQKSPSVLGACTENCRTAGLSKSSLRECLQPPCRMPLP